MGQRHKRHKSGGEEVDRVDVYTVYCNFYDQGYILLVLALSIDFLLLPSCPTHGKGTNVDTKQTIIW